jgi:hypothetical protein
MNFRIFSIYYNSKHDIMSLAIFTEAYIIFIWTVMNPLSPGVNISSISMRMDIAVDQVTTLRSIDIKWI